MVVSYDLCIFYLFQNGGEFSKRTMGQKLFIDMLSTPFVHKTGCLTIISNVFDDTVSELFVFTVSINLFAFGFPLRKSV